MSVQENDKELIIGKQTVYFKSSTSMVELLDGSIDIGVTSPPYNRRKKYSDIFTDNLPERDYHALLRTVFSECFRVLKPNSLFFLNIGDAARDQGKSERVAQLVERCGFKRIQTIIWVKSLLGRGHYTPSGGNRRLNNLWEYIFMFAKGRNYEIDPRAIGIPYADKGNIGRYSEVDLRDAGNVWFMPYPMTTGKTIKKGHIAPFPIELPYRCIKLAKNVKTVLDPFGGTCSTLTAAHYLNLRGYAYEKYPLKEVIKNRILNSNFSPQKQVLIPDTEKTIQYFNELLHALMRNDPAVLQRSLRSLSQKELQLMRSVSTGLGIEDSVLDNILNQNKPTNAKCKRLDDYFFP